MERNIYTLDHSRKGVVKNFCRICHVCLSVTQSDDNFQTQSLGVECSYLHIRYISIEYGSSQWVKFVYEGHQVKVKVTGAKRSKIPIPTM